MTEVFYKKVGRKYVPVAEYNSSLLDSIPYGHFLLSVFENGSSRSRVMPAFAPMIAAGLYSKDTITRAIREASELRPRNIPVTPGQAAAWKKLQEEFGEDRHCLTWPAAQDTADDVVKAMQVQADKYLTDPMVRKAYDHFLLIVELTKDKYDTI